MSIPEDRDNGILAQIRGEILGAAWQTLPTADHTQQPELVVEVDAGPPHGMVRVRYKLMSHKRRRDVHWFWTPWHAERVK